MRWQGACSGLDGRRCAGPSHGARHAAASPRKRGEVRAAAKCDRPLTGEGRRKGGAVAHQCSAGFVPIRKKGKLPYKRVSIGYSLEYGVDEMEMHEDGVAIGERVVLVDDLVATGGTAEAAVRLLRKIGAEVLAACFIIDLPELGGAAQLRALDVPVRTLISFEGH